LPGQRTVVDLQLENDLRASKERMYLTVEEKKRLEDQLSSAQSVAFTSDHQLRSVQVMSLAQSARCAVICC